MKRTRSLITDLFLMGFFILIFICVAYITTTAENLLINLVLMCVSVLIVIISFFTSLTTGLIINTASIFALISYVLYTSISSGIGIQSYIYFWMIISPLLTVTATEFSSRTRELERENELLRIQVEDFATLDEQTGLKNLRAFETEAYVYMNIAKRYELELCLMTVEMRHQREIERLMKKDVMDKTVLPALSKAIEESLRTEDVVYVLDNVDFLWGALLLTNFKAEDVIKNRIRKTVSELDFRRSPTSRKPNIELRIGIIPFDATAGNIDALEFLSQARRKMEYDV